MIDKNEGFIILAPIPTQKDYMFSMDKSEGLCDVFDILDDYNKGDVECNK
jgi:hypothetical protein